MLSQREWQFAKSENFMFTVPVQVDVPHELAPIEILTHNALCCEDGRVRLLRVRVRVRARVRARARARARARVRVSLLVPASNRACCGWLGFRVRVLLGLGLAC